MSDSTGDRGWEGRDGSLTGGTLRNRDWPNWSGLPTGLGNSDRFRGCERTGREAVRLGNRFRDRFWDVLIGNRIRLRNKICQGLGPTLGLLSLERARKHLPLEQAQEQPPL